MLFVQPADWEKREPQRAQADPECEARAQQADISPLLEKEPKIMVG